MTDDLPLVTLASSAFCPPPPPPWPTRGSNAHRPWCAAVEQASREQVNVCANESQTGPPVAGATRQAYILRRSDASGEVLLLVRASLTQFHVRVSKNAQQATDSAPSSCCSAKLEHSLSRPRHDLCAERLQGAKPSQSPAGQPPATSAFQSDERLRVYARSSNSAAQSATTTSR